MTRLVLSIILAFLFSGCSTTHKAWRALNAPQKNYTAHPYTRCMWENEAPNAKLFHEACEDR